MLLGDSASSLFTIVQLAIIVLLLFLIDFFYLLFHGIAFLVFIGLVRLLSVFSWNSTPVELILVLLEVRH